MMNPNDYIYFHDRLNFDGGDNGFAIPIAKCTEGTIFASFSSSPIEKDPLSRLTKVNTALGWSSVWSMKDPWNTWPGGHWPMIVCYPCNVPTVKIYTPVKTIVKYFGQVIVDARLEGHETPYYVDGKHFPRIDWMSENLQPFQTGDQRTDQQETTNQGDSSLPRFAQDIDGNISFLGQEVYLRGGGTNSPVYIRMLEEMKSKGKTINYEVMDVYDLRRPWLNFRHPDAPQSPILTPQDRPGYEPPIEEPTPEPEPTPQTGSSMNYSNLKWTITKRKESNANSIQVSDLSFYSNNTRIPLTSFSIIALDNRSPSAEKPIKLIDGSVDTKWLDFNFSLVDGLEGESCVILSNDTPITFDSYSWSTANDAIGRDPVSWKLEGSNDGTNWELIHQVDDFPVTDSRKTVVNVWTVGSSEPIEPPTLEERVSSLEERVKVLQEKLGL